MASATSTVTPTIDKPPTFDEVAAELATADAAVKLAKEDKKVAEEKRGTLATDSIRAAHREKLASSDVRAVLLSKGVLKGTVSKITTVLDALAAKEINIKQVKSLNHAYTLVRNIHAAAASGVAGATGSGSTSRVISTPEDAIDVIIATIKKQAKGDPDETLKLVGEWMTKVTTALTDFNKKVIAEADEE